jgi:hypothetical protein
MDRYVFFSYYNYIDCTHQNIMPYLVQNKFYSIFYKGNAQWIGFSTTMQLDSYEYMHAAGVI